MKGFSVLEVILSVAIFIVFSSGAIFVVLQGLDSNRLGEEETVANQYATEGLEAVRSIKNQSFSNLVATTSSGLTRNASNVWALSGLSNTFGKYTRVVSISAAFRDLSGNLVSSVGTPDANTRKVMSTVSWNVSPTRNDSVSLTTYLTNWKDTITNGLAVYSDTVNLSQPRFRRFIDSTNTFEADAATGGGFSDAAVGKNFFVQTSPTRREAIAGYVNASGVLRIMCYEGNTWTSEWTATVGGTGVNDGRFSIAYEKSTGDAMVVYSTNTAASNEMAYRTKPGTSGCGSANWSGATNISTVRTTGIVQWIRMESSPVGGSNTIALAWADANSDLSAMEWTGSSWAVAEPTAALETNLERVTTSQDVLSFDISFESITGNLMVVWGLSQATSCTAGTTIATTNCIRYARYTNAWSAVAVVPTVAAPATNIDIASNPNSNEMIFGAMDDNQLRLSAAYWSGSAWTGTANVDTTCQAVTAGSKRVATGWLISGATTRSIIVYNDSATTNIGWVVGNGATFAVQTDSTPTPAFANPQTWYRIDSDPVNKDRLMFTLSDNNSDFFAKRLVMTSTPAFTWSGSDGNAALDANLGQATSRPYGFAYWHN